MSNALIYLRVSTKEQAEKGDSERATRSRLSGKPASDTAPSDLGTWPTSS